MSSGGEPPQISKIQVLSDEKSLFALRDIPDLGVALSRQTFFHCCVDSMTEVSQRNRQTEREILVQLDLHRTWGVSGTGKSSSAEAAANAIAARTCFAFRVGNCSRMVSTFSPVAREASTVRNVTRVPLNTGSPPQIRLSRMMCSPYPFVLSAVCFTSLASTKAYHPVNHPLK
jgi:hypothetical protein